MAPRGVVSLIGQREELNTVPATDKKARHEPVDMTAEGRICEEDGCDGAAAFELHIPWKANEFVCPGHARVKARQEGIVADALDNADDELPEGAGTRQ